MNDYQLVISEVKKQIDNTQSKINMYYDQRPPSQCFYPPEQRPVFMVQPVMTYSPISMQQSNKIIPQSYFSTQMPSSPIINVPVTQPFLSRTSSSPNRTQNKINTPALPPINMTNQQINNVRLKAAQANVLKNQVQINRLHKQKHNYEQFLQNSMITQNNVINFPYGGQHSSLMQKIISQKNIDDYQNERILLRFQKQAEEFKKSKSRHLKHLQNIVVNSNYIVESQYASPQRERSEVDLNVKSMFFSSKKFSQQNKKQNVQKVKSNLPSQSQTISVPQLNVSEYTPTVFQHSYETPRAKQRTERQISLPSPSIKVRTRKFTKLLPITDDGQDGLKLIRKNLFHRRKKHTQPQHKIHYSQKSLQDSDQQKHQHSVQQINHTIKQISDIMKSNRSFLTNIKRIKTQPTQNPQQSYSPASSSFNNTNLQQTKQKSINQIHIDSPKIRLNLSKLKKRPIAKDQNLLQSRRKLMQLSDIYS